MIKLKTILEIKTGYNYNRIYDKYDKDNNGESYKLLTIKSFDFEKNIIEEELELITFKKDIIIPEYYLTKKGDIIIKPTAPIEIIYIDKEHENLVIPSYLMILRNKSDINSSYIFYVLKLYKEKISVKAQGTGIQKVQKKDIEELEIPEPIKEDEKLFEIIQNLYKKEIELFELKKEFYNNSLIKLIIKAEKDEKSII